MTVRHSNPIICQEKWKKLRSWKNEAQNRVRIFWQNLIFWAETFIQRLLQTFLWALRTCSTYLKGPLQLVLYVSKKIVTVRHSNTKILTKKVKKSILYYFPCHDCSYCEREVFRLSQHEKTLLMMIFYVIVSRAMSTMIVTQICK